MKNKVLVIVLSIIFVIFSTLSIIGYIEHNSENKSNVDDTNDETIVKLKCTFDGELKQGTEYVNGQYTYRYMQSYGYTERADGGVGWDNILDEGWGVILTDKESTEAVTSKLCSSINGKPIVSMSWMFYQANADSIDLSSFDTSNVTDMNSMFYESSSTKVKKLDNFNTINVTDMSTMFADSAIEIIDLSSFDTSKVTDMNSMFYHSSATNLNLNNFDTSNVTSMSNMFDGSKVTTLDVSSFDTSNVTNMVAMFRGCDFAFLDLSNFDTSNVTDMSWMFADSSILTIDLSNFDTSNVTSMANMFDGSKVTTLDLSSFDTSKVTDMSDMFYDSQATTGYARTKDDANKFNSSINKPTSLTFATKNEENNSKDEYAKSKELFIYFVKKYDEFLIYTYEIDDSKFEYIDSYKCINDSCKYSLDKNILAVYDDNKVLYKDLNKKEDFKESKIEKTYKYYDKINKKNKEIKSYKIMNDYFFVVDNKICLNNKHSKASFHELGCKYFNYDSLEAGYVMIIKNEFHDEYEPDGMIYDINKEKIVYTFDHYGFPKSFYKEGDFYILAHNGWSSSNYEEEIFLSNFKHIDNTGYYYIKDNLLYYVGKYKLNVIDKNNNIVDYPNEDIKALKIDSSYLLYLDKDNSIKIKNFDNDKILDVSNYKVNINNYKKFYIGNNGNIYIAYSDISAGNTNKWKELVKEYNDLTAKENAGYLLEFNQNNELLKNEVVAIMDGIGEYDIWTGEN